MAKDTLEEAACRLRRNAGLAVDHVVGRDATAALTAVRAVLSDGSKLYARLSVIAELADEGSWRAAVDRAVAAGEVAQIPGQASIVDEVKRLAERASKEPRSRKGKPGA